MGLSTSEQETVVQYDRDGDTATIYTSDSTQITRLDKIYKRHREHKDNGEIIAVEYVIDKKLVSYRSKRIQRNLTAEQRAIQSARMKTVMKKACREKA